MISIKQRMTISWETLAHDKILLCCSISVISIDQRIAIRMEILRTMKDYIAAVLW